MWGNEDEAIGFIIFRSFLVDFLVLAGFGGGEI